MLIELTKLLEQDGKTIRREAHLELEDIRIFGNPYKLQDWSRYNWKSRIWERK